MENKVRYKLHKVKKQWVTIAVSVATLASVLGGTVLTSNLVSADETTGDQVTAAIEDNADSSTTVTSETTSSEAVVSDSTVSSTSVETEVSATSEVTTETTTSESTSTSTSEVSTTSEAASETVEADKAPVSSAEVVTEATSGLSSTEVEAALSLDKIKLIDGSYRYVNDDGSYKKNFAITVNGQLLYFDGNGALTSTSTYSFTEGLTNQVDTFTLHNAAKDSTTASFELVDGYLTANSWYRPAYIYENGKTWVESKESDLRPILMSWWPDKDTQVDYLNYMTKAMDGEEGTFTLETSQTALNVAAQIIQTKIEQRITAEQSTEWLRTAIKTFVSTQSKWNKDSENYNKADHLQGGALLYTNSDLTPWANSSYRLLNRTPTNQTGEIKYTKGNDNGGVGGYEFLLSNDVDNSNPTVQAEQLNQLYYLMNWGSIVFGDSDANFDGVRVDAVDNVNADMLQLYTRLFKSAYKVSETEANALAHISILEAWSHNDPYYNYDTNGAALAMDNGLRLSLLYALTRPITSETGGETRTANLKDLVNGGYYGLADRSDVTSYDELGKASYVFVRAHDSEVQTVIAKIIAEKNPDTDGFTFTLKELEEAFKTYNEDMNKVEKKYTHYNIPAAYALMLQNMGQVTRVYYGDLYTDNGQYMETKSPYYDQITTLLQARSKYVAGGQTSYIADLDATRTFADGSDASYNNGIYVSVRYGQDLMSATDTEGTENSRTSGMLTLVSNNPQLELKKDAVLKVNMGAAHANQAYRPLIRGTENGIVSSLTDADTDVVKYTDASGYLTFTADEIKGFSTVDMSGYVSVWVPVGASEDQNVLATASTETKTEGEQVYKPSAALEAQVIYEGFSNFQDFVKTDNQYTNKKIAENTDLFKSWGITSFELAPQYVSTTDGTFLDSIIENGYAFDDRYDLAMSKNNKYGSSEDLRNALKALHAAGIQAIADWVPDQIYTLTGEEVVTATRTDNFGNVNEDAELVKKLYVANTKSSGSDYQAQYGGEYLEYLQKTYPELFTEVMISTGQTIDASVKIKQWKAEYLNGTNVLDRGSDYVLSDGGTYFTVTKDGAFLPAQLTGDQTATTGFFHDGTGMTYRTSSGTQAKSQFVTYEGNKYYFDKDGHMVVGAQEIGDYGYYFLPNGIMLKDAYVTNTNGTTYYYGKSGKRKTSSGWKDYEVTTTDSEGKEVKSKVYRYFYEGGVMAQGISEIDGATYYFLDSGVQVKGNFLKTDKGIIYFDADSGQKVYSKFVTVGGQWYYAGSSGYLLTGEQTINESTYFFKEDGLQVKGEFITDDTGKRSYYDADSGKKKISKFFSVNDTWYYADSDGYVVTGFQTIQGKRYYFNADGSQVKSSFFTTGDNAWYYANQNGVIVTGAQTINGQSLYFDEETGKQVKGGLVTAADGSKSYYDADSGEKLTSDFFTTGDNVWYYADANGKIVTGAQVIKGQTLYFDENGVQAKGTLVRNSDNSVSYYDPDSGDKVFNKWVTLSTGRRIYFNTSGKAVLDI
ncbi:glycoside hydrolase family 70 protein [Streptococcus dentiloxodontae]